MATKTHMITCRLDDRDYGSLHENAAALDVAPSTYMRYLIRIPVSACPDPKGSRVLVVDAKTLGALRYELVRWGRHYNQGVHALNAIAYVAVSYTHLDVYKRQIPGRVSCELLNELYIKPKGGWK